MALLTFTLPPDAGEKISLGKTDGTCYNFGLKVSLSVTTVAARPTAETNEESGRRKYKTFPSFLFLMVFVIEHSFAPFCTIVHESQMIMWILGETKQLK